MIRPSDNLARDQEQDRAQSPAPAAYRPRDGARPTVKGLRLSPELIARIGDRARQEKATVHGALCAALVLASREAFAAWRESPLRILSPISTRPFMDAGETCGLFVGATTTVFGGQTMDFWDIARDARNGIAASKTKENIAARLAALRGVVEGAAEVTTAADFAAKIFASDILLTNLGRLSFDQEFGPVTLKAMFGLAILMGSEDQQAIGVATVNGALCLLHASHMPLEALLAKMQNVLTRACGEDK